MKRDREARWDLVSPVGDIEVRVRNDLAGLRLDSFMKRRFPWRSRSAWAEQIKQGKVTVDGFRARVAQKVMAGQVITIECSGKNLEYIDPDSIALNIIWEDEHCLVLNKEAGRAVHPVGKTLYGTYLSAIVARYSEESEIRPTLVHRLDRDTSGVLMVAKNSRAASAMAVQFEKREVKKDYHALVSGVPRQDSGVIDAPIGYAGGEIRLQRAVVPSGQKAVTRYRVLRRGQCSSGHDFSLVQCQPLTGRTHQIRVHLSYLGHPVVGDWLYGSNIQAERFMLHAARLELFGPSGDILKLFAPHPPEFRRAIRDYICGI